VAQTYSPGDIVPRDGKVECTQFNGTRDNVKKGTRFAPLTTGGTITAESALGSTSNAWSPAPDVTAVGQARGQTRRAQRRKGWRRVGSQTG